MLRITRTTTNSWPRLREKQAWMFRKGLDATHNKMIAPFEKLKGAAFDRGYAHEMVVGHQKAIAQYQQESKNGSNPEIKAYATQALPTLEKHLQAAKELTPAKGTRK